MQTVRITPEHMDGSITEVLPFIVEACKAANGRYDVVHVLDFVRREVWQLWAMIDEMGHIRFIAGTELVIYPTGLKSIAWRFGIGEGALQETPEFVSDILGLAKEQGCKRSDGCFRKGWRRQIPFKSWAHTHEFLEIEL